MLGDDVSFNFVETVVPPSARLASRKPSPGASLGATQLETGLVASVTVGRCTVPVLEWSDYGALGVSRFSLEQRREY